MEVFDQEQNPSMLCIRYMADCKSCCIKMFGSSRKYLYTVSCDVFLALAYSKDCGVYTCNVIKSPKPAKVKGLLSFLSQVVEHNLMPSLLLFVKCIHSLAQEDHVLHNLCFLNHIQNWCSSHSIAIQTGFSSYPSPFQSGLKHDIYWQHLLFLAHLP